MKTVLILHGINGFAGWQESIKKHLISKKYNVIMPVFPNWDHPDRAECLQAVKDCLKNIDLNYLIIIGHSLGATTACDFIETLNCPIYKFISVSGFAKDYHYELNSYFLKEKSVDYKKVVVNTKKRIVIYGDNDPYVPQNILSGFAGDIHADDIIVVENGGHLSTGSGFIEFPLLEDLIEEDEIEN